ncbi:MAG: 5-methyltetrahydropteroyltriglutamate--homocysteine S-methyltransferase [Alphaproteobacteria bacterium]|jgi:5-methyltetrahydropteroyltriglutamate--homocysteine methyltransferase|nr:5-methyltetrahydropteroyltriglutamate--homocysteine S-methyltransferase [Alphaproteobacteria bacterium]
MPPPPFRAEHVGSLLRPKELTAAFRQHNAGEIDDAAFAQVQDTAIRDVVAQQEAAGLGLVTDGEFRRGSYWGHVIGPVTGLSVREAEFRFHDDHGHEQSFIAAHVEGKVRREKGFSTGEFGFLKSIAKAIPKITMPSLPTFHFYRPVGGIDASVYGTPREFFLDFAEVFRQEIAALAKLGATYIQMDEVPLAMLCDGQVREQVRAGGADPDELIAIYIDAINDAVEGRPEGMICGLHLCRGNFKGKYLSQGGYEPVAERLFNDLSVDAFFLEYDTARAGDFSPLRLVPKDKHVVLGLVSSKLAEMESVDDLARRIDQAAQFISLERLSISPQCGFASAVSGNPITQDVQQAKLARIVETALQVWGEV